MNDGVGGVGGVGFGTSTGFSSGFCGTCTGGGVGIGGSGCGVLWV